MSIPRRPVRFILILAAPGIAALAGPPAARAVPVVPSGYFLVTFAEGVPNPTSLAFGADGWLYVTRLDGVVTALRDLDGNGAADSVRSFAAGFTLPLGVAVRNGQVYVSSRTAVTRLTDTDGDHVADVTEPIITDLPAGKHWTTGLAFGPDDNLYVGVGSNSNRGAPSHPWHATILKFTVNGAFLQVFATGLRNPYDMAFNYAGQLFATDNGAGPDTAWNCNEAPDELNWITSGGQYGFPDCFGAGDCADVSAFCSPAPCGSGDCETGGGCTPSMKAPIALLDPHSSSDGLVFGDAFSGFTRNDLFIAQFGQTEFIEGCRTEFGHRIVRTRIRRHGQQWEADPAVDFVTGLDLPLDLTVGPDGAMYIAEFGLGRILRLAPTGVGAAPEPEAPATPGLPRFRFSPNPARDEARVEWETEPPPGISFRVYDLTGRRIAEIDAGDDGRAVWRLRDDRGRRVSPGLYLVDARAALARGSARLLVVEK